MIAIMCAATVATSGVVTSVGAAGKTKAIKQIKQIKQIESNIAELEQKQKELEEETSEKEKWLTDENRIEIYNKKIEKIKADIKADIEKSQIKINDSKGKINFSNKDRQNAIRLQSAIEMIKQDRARENRNSIELINKNKKALKDIDRQIKDARKQVEFMQAFQALNDEINKFTRWNASKKAVVSYTDVIAKNIMARCLELKNNFQACRANAIIQQIEKSIEAMQQYIKKYELKHANENNQKNLVKDKNNETIKNSKMLGPSKRLVPQFKKMMILTKIK